MFNVRSCAGPADFSVLAPGVAEHPASTIAPTPIMATPLRTDFRYRDREALAFTNALMLLLVFRVCLRHGR
jgi:hypothetical protein